MSELLTQIAQMLWGAGLWWAALAVIIIGAVIIVLARRDFFKMTEPPPPPVTPDVSDIPGRPDAKWGDNVEANDQPGGGMEGG